MLDELQVLIEDGQFLPMRAYQGDAGADLMAREDTILLPGETKAIGTGVKALIPYNYVGLVCARSGLALKHNVWMANGIGIIDHQYRGEIKALLHNGGKENYHVCAGDRIAQLVIMYVKLPYFRVVKSLPESSRNENGFGSTGK